MSYLTNQNTQEFRIRHSDLKKNCIVKLFYKQTGIIFAQHIIGRMTQEDFWRTQWTAELYLHPPDFPFRWSANAPFEKSNVYSTCRASSPDEFHTTAAPFKPHYSINATPAKNARHITVTFHQLFIQMNWTSSHLFIIPQARVSCFLSPIKAEKKHGVCKMPRAPKPETASSNMILHCLPAACVNNDDSLHNMTHSI